MEPPRLPEQQPEHSDTQRGIDRRIYNAVEDQMMLQVDHRDNDKEHRIDAVRQQLKGQAAIPGQDRKQQRSDHLHPQHAPRYLSSADRAAPLRARYPTTGSISRGPKGVLQ